LLFTKTELHALAGSKKIDILKQVEGACQDCGVVFKAHVKPKKEDGAAQMRELIDVLKSSGETPVVGSFPKEKPSGAFAEAWFAALESSQLPVVDVAGGVGSVLAVKDADETRNIKKAAYLVSNALQLQGVKDIEETIDQEKKVKHSKIAEHLEDAIANPAKVNVKLKPELVDVAYAPLVQSGGEYDFKLSAVSNEKPMHYGVICCQLGAR
jgi:nucleosome binding factor SPN SPT16 subunit